MFVPSSKPRHVLLAAACVMLGLFGVVVAGMTWQLRQRLRTEVLRREAEAIHAVAQMQLGARAPSATPFASDDATQSLFTAVLETSRLRGVLAVHLFAPDGALRAMLPETGGSPSRWWQANLTEPVARFFPDGALETVYSLPIDQGDVTRAPLLEIVVPLHFTPPAQSVGTARYWIDGASTAEEFARMDRGLLTQAAIALLGAALAIAVVLGWALARLADVNRRLLAQSVDLARANQELDFAARTSAIGAISAHLIHGLKNPLSGLEGFVVENATETTDSARGEAWRAAVDTTRRLRSLVNEVVTVLRDAAEDRDDYRVPLDEIIAAAQQRARSRAAQAGVEIIGIAAARGEVLARTANLAGLVLANLLANAIEASPRGEKIKLTAGATEHGVEFFVVDAGAGIPADVRSVLFRPLRSAKPGGGGVGLAISRQLARHAGGDLELVRSDAQGTVFRLRVPAATSPSQ